MNYFSNRPLHLGWEMGWTLDWFDDEVVLYYLIFEIIN